jgi:hypothetical protein
MFIAIVTQKVKDNKETFYSGGIGQTLEEAAVAANKVATQARQSYPSYTYIVYVAEATHKVVPPENKIDLEPIKSSW